jgi:hypothetical protein
VYPHPSRCGYTRQGGAVMARLIIIAAIIVLVLVLAPAACMALAVILCPRKSSTEEGEPGDR